MHINIEIPSCLSAKSCPTISLSFSSVLNWGILYKIKEKNNLSPHPHMAFGNYPKYS